MQRAYNGKGEWLLLGESETTRLSCHVDTCA